MLSIEEKKQYNRHLILPEVGVKGQEKLKQAKVLVIGAGGLGCPVLQYLTAAGIGTLGIVDFDVVELSNLQRQILYQRSDIGLPKAVKAAQRLETLNPFIQMKVFNTRLTPGNALELVTDFDIVVDGSDNFATRYLLNDACILADKPLVSGAIFKFEGQVSVFNYQGSGSYRCLFPEENKDDQTLNCAQVGVLGVLPGIIGTLQANEVIKMVVGIGETLAGKLLVMDALGLTFQTYSYTKNPENFNITELRADYSHCELEGPASEISAEMLKTMIGQHQLFQMVDVRSEEEYKAFHLDAENIPLNLIEENLHKIEKELPVIFYCQSGGRSKAALLKLQKHGYKNVSHLTGGLNAWSMVVV